MISFGAGQGSIRAGTFQADLDSVNCGDDRYGFELALSSLIRTVDTWREYEPVVYICTICGLILHHYKSSVGNSLEFLYKPRTADTQISRGTGLVVVVRFEGGLE